MAQRHKPCLANSSAGRVRFPIVLQTPPGKISVAVITAAWMLSSAIAFAADFETEEAAFPSPRQFDSQRFGGIRGKLHDWKVTVGIGAVYLP